MPSRPAVFLDRDGVIIESRPDYVRTWAQVKFLPGSLEALRELASSSFTTLIVTNQSMIGRGIAAEEAALELHSRIVDEIRGAGGDVEASFLCPHAPGDGCECRKPAPGLLLRAARELDIDLASSYLVGDALTDIDAAIAAGVRSVLVLTGRGREEAEGLEGPRGDCAIVSNLAAAVRYILEGGEG